MIKSPHSVLLLDEIEKAHTDVMNILLQVMDHGTLTDANGRKTDFRNVVIVMTTNAGAEKINRASIGFTMQNHASDAGEEVKSLSPRNSGTGLMVLSIAPLGTETIAHVVDKFLVELESQLDEQKSLC